MGPYEREAARRRGRHRLDAMRRRTTRLRERVVVAAIAGFVLLWSVVFVQMATGNDPVLGSGRATQRQTRKAAARHPERSSPRAAPPEEESETADAEGVEAEEIEAEGVEAEAAETEQLEVERLEAEEAEALELAELEAEELEAVTSGQS